jgi:hypothetical protein
MKKLISWILVISTAVAVGIGASVAFLTDTDEDINVRTIGNVKIQQHEQERTDPEGDGSQLQDFTDNKALLPAVVDPALNWENASGGLWDPTQINNELDKLITVENTGDYEAFVRTVLAFEAGSYTFEQFQEKIHLNLNQNDWDYEWVTEPVIIGQNSFFLATATHKVALQPGQTTAPSLLQVALDKTATNEDVHLFGDDYLILAASQAIQTEGFEDPLTALETGFHKASPQQHPFSEAILPYYVSTVEDFKNFAARGGTGILMADLELDSYVLFNRKGTVLDMNGHTIVNKRPGSTTFIIRVDLGGELTVTGNGKFISAHKPEDLKGEIMYFVCTSEGSLLVLNDCEIDVNNLGAIRGSKVVQAQSKGKVIINSGVYVRDCAATSASALIYTMSGAHIEINGGLFQNRGNNSVLLNTHDGRPGTMLIRGGTFINHKPGTNDAYYITVAEGYEIVSEVIDGDTYYTVVPKE